MSEKIQDQYTQVADGVVEALFSYKLSLREIRLSLWVARWSYGMHKKSVLSSYREVGQLLGWDKSDVGKVCRPLVRDKILFCTLTKDKQHTRFRLNKRVGQWKRVLLTPEAPELVKIGVARIIKNAPVSTRPGGWANLPSGGVGKSTLTPASGVGKSTPGGVGKSTLEVVGKSTHPNDPQTRENTGPVDPAMICTRYSKENRPHDPPKEKKSESAEKKVSDSSVWDDVDTPEPIDTVEQCMAVMGTLTEFELRAEANSFLVRRWGRFPSYHEGESLSAVCKNNRVRPAAILACVILAHGDVEKKNLELEADGLSRYSKPLAKNIEFAAQRVSQLGRPGSHSPTREPQRPKPPMYHADGRPYE